MTSYIDELKLGLNTAFVDGSLASSLAYRPQFVSNNYKEGKKVLASIEEELLSCDKFQISVAFITMGGITPLLQTLKELEKRGVPGEILTTNYLNFSEPGALKKLNSLKNVKLKMFDVDAYGDGFHTKGYIFKKEEIYRIIVGSSNITKSALTTNREWNTKIVSTEQGEVAKEILAEYEELWNSEYALDFDTFFESYEEKYNIIKKQREIAAAESIVSLEKYKLEPNSMQVAFITNIRRIIESGEEKALLISATGTGKTYASAFAMREFGFKRVLFLVQRSELARQSRNSYHKIMPNDVTMGLVGDGLREYDKDYVFATVQSISRDEHLSKYESDAFDCIIVDEAHHSPAGSYQKVMNYFKPKLWLGMTATPDKRDDNIEGRNVYELFNHKIAYEIRLQKAMEEDLLCPFHYFGISEVALIDEAESKKNKLSEEDFRKLTSEERVKHIVNQADFYGYSGDRVKGLIFCSHIDESEELSRKLNETINPETGKKFRTVALNGSASSELRQETFERLVAQETEENEDEVLDYILSVDILNEGVDIVEVNQVIMLRPTQSPIVFIQQLGRGLRKAEGKEYVVVLDFIGNYTNNFMIPIALSGDRSYNKDSVRRYVREGMRVIPGASTVHFDEVSRRKIFSSIDKADFSDKDLIKANYFNLKNKLGRIPDLGDFDLYGEMDVTCIFNNSKMGSYYRFLVDNEQDYKIRLNDKEEKFIEFVSKKLANGKRVHELELLDRTLKYSKGIVSEWKKSMEDKYGIVPDMLVQQNVVNVMTNEFPTGSGKNTYSDCIFIEHDRAYEDYDIAEDYADMLKNPEFYEILQELVAFGINRYKDRYSNRYMDTDFVLYQKYTYEDVCRILNWEHNEVPLNIGGYKYDKVTNTFPVFINYEKDEDIADTTKYEDHFVSNSQLIAISKSNRTVESDDVQNFLHAKDRGIEVELFIRKNKDDKISKEFYYLGKMTATGRTKEFIMPNTDKTAVEIEWNLDTPVREDIYDYLVG